MPPCEYFWTASARSRRVCRSRPVVCKSLPARALQAAASGPCAAAVGSRAWRRAWCRRRPGTGTCRLLPGREPAGTPSTTTSCWAGWRWVERGSGWSWSSPTGSAWPSALMLIGLVLVRGHERIVALSQRGAHSTPARWVASAAHWLPLVTAALVGVLGRRRAGGAFTTAAVTAAERDHTGPLTCPSRSAVDQDESTRIRRSVRCGPVASSRLSESWKAVRYPAACRCGKALGAQAPYG